MSAVVVRALAGGDRAAWEPLWDAYLAFYDTRVDAEVTDVVFHRLVDPGWAAQVGWLAERDGDVVGFAHVGLQHSTWAVEPDLYLEDLFVAPDARGGGVARALLGHLAAEAADHGWRRVHWQTDADNARARRLYDDVAEAVGQVRYVLRTPPADDTP